MWNRFFWIACLAIPLTANADVYKWTDDNGNVHFTEQEKPGASQINVDTESVPLGDENTSSANPPSDKELQKENFIDEHIGYKSVKIQAPVHEETIRDAEGRINVVVETEPGLRKKHKIAIFVDGRKVSDTDQMMFTITNIERGEHVIEAAIVEAGGAEILRSDKITVFMQPPRVSH